MGTWFEAWSVSAATSYLRRPALHLKAAVSQSPLVSSWRRDVRVPVIGIDPEPTYLGRLDGVPSRRAAMFIEFEYRREL